MSVPSSVSTYLDVTQAAKGAPAPAPETSGPDPEFTAQAAKVLAAINSGTDLVAELPEHSGIEAKRILAVLAWLSDSGLVDVDDVAGALRVRLTEAAHTALAAE